MGYCFLLLLRPLHDSLATENDCSGNDGASKLFWFIKNFSSCCFLVAIEFFSHFICKCQCKKCCLLRDKTKDAIDQSGAA